MASRPPPKTAPRSLGSMVDWEVVNGQMTAPPLSPRKSVGVFPWASVGQPPQQDPLDPLVEGVISPAELNGTHGGG